MLCESSHYHFGKKILPYIILIFYLAFISYDAKSLAIKNPDKLDGIKMKIIWSLRMQRLNRVTHLLGEAGLELSSKKEWHWISTHLSPANSTKMHMHYHTHFLLAHSSTGFIPCWFGSITLGLGMTEHHGKECAVDQSHSHYWRHACQE